MSATYLTFAGAVTLLIASPGPVVALVIADARRGGLWWTLLGGVLSAQVLMVGALVMIAMALQVHPGVLSWGQVLGGGYLLWLGLDALRAAPESPGECTDQPAVRRFWKALAVGLSNPKDILFFLAFLPGFIRVGAPFMQQALILLLIWVAIDLAVLLSYGLLFQRLAGHPQVDRWLRQLPGYVLIGFGGLALSVGLQRL
ncbi:MAG TPA: LysE family translocator [Pseudomonas sp.]|uniref:LysE family translocator n=1 Tax=Pseudomonas sp. TaxID=306 RepID=UPI002C59C6C7|nr:LysE family translocator [Pseudomonas sp.]HTO20023.1 LysE family translocator [Pseudomonas sp.]